MAITTSNPGAYTPSLTVACPTCGSEPFQSCAGPKFHTARFKAANPRPDLADAVPYGAPFSR